jgi:hypothetical protein
MQADRGHSCKLEVLEEIRIVQSSVKSGSDLGEIFRSITYTEITQAERTLYLLYFARQSFPLRIIHCSRFASCFLRLQNFESLRSH